MTPELAAEIRFRRMARARDICLQELRRHLGQHLPLPVVAAVNELAIGVMRIAIPDEQLEVTTVDRRGV